MPIVLLKPLLNDRILAQKVDLVQPLDSEPGGGDKAYAHIDSAKSSAITSEKFIATGYHCGKNRVKNRPLRRPVESVLHHRHQRTRRLSLWS